MPLRCGIVLMFALLLCAPSDADAQRMPARVRTVLARAFEWYLCTLDPITTIEKHGPERAPDGFHGWLASGYITVPPYKERNSALQGLERAMSSKKPLGAKCFIPRHGIRAAYRGDTVDLVICFECEWVHVYIKPRGGKELKTILPIESTPQAALDMLIKSQELAAPPR